MNPPREPVLLLYRLARFVLWCLLRVCCRFEARGVEHIPNHGACILAANHVSFLDPPALGVGAANRHVHFMARDTLFRFPLVAWMPRRLGLVEIDRTRGDVGALRAGLHLLKRGGVLGLFPEGTRSPDGRLHKAKGGIGFLIAKAKAPVVPVYIDGTYRTLPKGASWVKPGKITIIFGPPLSPEEVLALGDGKDQYEKIGDRVMARIAALKPDAG